MSAWGTCNCWIGYGGADCSACAEGYLRWVLWCAAGHLASHSALRMPRQVQCSTAAMNMQML